MRKLRFLVIWLLLASLLLAAGGMAEELIDEPKDEWITFLLVCNEGMNNDSGNVGNTLMIMSMNPYQGIIKELAFLWDTFIQYPGYETAQLLDQPFRVDGPEESLKLFNENFQQDISSYLSINFLNLAEVIDTFGGVQANITRPERNALNGMVASKAENILTALTSIELDETQFQALVGQYYLSEYGPNTRVSGLQAVGYGWLQYDSIANCCSRQLEVIAELFFQMQRYIEQRTYFYRGDEKPGESAAGKRAVSLDAISVDDHEFLMNLVSPVFDNSYHNLTDEQIWGIIETILYTAYSDEQQKESAYSTVQMAILPLEYENERMRIGGIGGLVVDYEANRDEIEKFLYDPLHAPMIYDPEEENRVMAIY